MDAFQVRENRRFRAFEFDGQCLFCKRAIRKKHREEDENAEQTASKEARGDLDSSRVTRRAIGLFYAQRESEGAQFTSQPGGSAEEAQFDP